MKKNSTKKYSINKKKFIIAISILLIIAICIVILCSFKHSITNDTNMSNLNAKKYSKELQDKYNQDGMQQQFLTDYEYVQNNVGMYILNNSTMDNDSYLKIAETLKIELKKDDWSKLEMNKPTKWNGVWSVDSNGNVRFKFESKSIEPEWIKNDKIGNKVITNN